MSHLPLLFASISEIEDNFQNVGLSTGFTIQQFLSQCVAVTILFIVMYVFAWKKVLVILDERRKAIEQAMKNADRCKQELADAESTRLSIIQKANEQATKIIADAEKSAAVVGERKTQDAARQAEDIIKSAHEAAVLDRNRLMAELKLQIGALVIQTTEKVAGKVLTPADQARLNDETLRNVEARNN
jgi:F-type H+-transporting ATPase subunit b